MIIFANTKRHLDFYLKAAAEAGVPEAQFNTASMYEHGEGVTSKIQFKLLDGIYNVAE